MRRVRKVHKRFQYKATWFRSWALCSWPDVDLLCLQNGSPYNKSIVHGATNHSIWGSQPQSLRKISATFHFSTSFLYTREVSFARHSKNAASTSLVIMRHCHIAGEMRLTAETSSRQASHPGYKELRRNSRASSEPN